MIYFIESNNDEFIKIEIDNLRYNNIFDFEYEIDFQDTNIYDFFYRFLQIDFFQKKKLIILKNATIFENFLKLKKMEQKFIIESFKKINFENLIFIFIVSKLKSTIFLETNNIKFKIIKNREFNRRNALNFLEEEIQKNKIELDKKLLNEIVDSTSNFLNLKNEIEKIKLYNSRIEKNNINQILSNYHEINVFELVDVILTRDVKTFLILLEKFKEQGINIIQIINLLISELLILDQILLEKNENNKINYLQFVENYKINVYRSKILFEKVSKLDRIEIRRILNNLYQIDIKFKTNSNNENILLTIFN